MQLQSNLECNLTQPFADCLSCLNFTTGMALDLAACVMLEKVNHRLQGRGVYSYEYVESVSTCTRRKEKG